MRYMISVALFASACGGSSTGPTPPPVVTPSTITLSGTVKATNGGQPLAGVQASLGTVSAMTDGSGSFSATIQPTGSVALALSGSSIVPRTVYVAAGSSRAVAVDAIAVAGFDLNFYRELVRNGYEQPGALQPVRRWTRNPNIYIQTGANAATVDMIERVIRDSVPQWTAGRLGVDAVERGTETREGQAGWITVKWITENTGHCGSSDVAVSGGSIDLQTGTPGCACNGFAIRPSTVRHEIGHSMGFWHTDTASDLMVSSSSVCDKPISSRELAAAAVAYSRPVGNLDPDQDPSGAVNLAPLRIH